MDMRYLSEAKYQFEDKLVSYDEFNKAIQDNMPLDLGQLYAYNTRMIGEFVSKEHNTSITISLVFPECEEDNTRMEMDFIHDSEEIKNQCYDRLLAYVEFQNLEPHTYKRREDGNYKVNDPYPEVTKYFDQIKKANKEIDAAHQNS